MTQALATAQLDVKNTQEKPAVTVSATHAQIIPSSNALTHTTTTEVSNDVPHAIPVKKTTLNPEKYDHFQPVLYDRHAEKEKPFMDALHVNFPTSTVFSYYPLLRAGGYMGEASTKLLSNKLEERMEALNEGAPKATGAFGKTVEKYIDYCVDRKDRLNTRKIDFMTPMVKAESIGFTGLALAFAGKDYQQLREDCGLAVSAELGKDIKDVGISDMCQSSNPIVSSAVDRFMWQTASRVGQGASFLGGLFSGIAGSTALITLERTVYYRPIAYDILRKSVNDVQLNRLGEEATPNLVDGFIRTMQATRIDQRRQLLSKEQIDGVRPVLERVAHDVINRSFGLRGVMYVLGGGVIVPDNPDLSMANYEHVFSVGVAGVAEEGKWIRDQTGAPINKTWQTAVRIKRDKNYVAESAREDALVETHNDIIARGALHSGYYRDGMRGGDRSGVGMSI